MPTTGSEAWSGGSSNECGGRDVPLGKSIVWTRIAFATDCAFLTPPMLCCSEFDRSTPFQPRTVAFQSLRERAAGEVFEREEGQTVAIADLEDLDDVRVPHCGHGFGFGEEADAFGGPRQVRAAEHLQGHGAVQSFLPGHVRDAVAPAAEFAEQFIARRRGPRQLRLAERGLRLSRRASEVGIAGRISVVRVRAIGHGGTTGGAEERRTASTTSRARTDAGFGDQCYHPGV